MKKFAVIGDPIAHSLSPILHQYIYHQLKIEASFKKINILPHGLPSFINSNELDGFNVTLPHKQTIIPYLDKLDEAAQTIGAVNCVHNGNGYNTDWIGFTKAMDQNGVSLNGIKCTILGAGGAARAIAFALIKSKANSISIINRTNKKANALVRWIESISDIPVHIQLQKNVMPQTPNHLIINCTPMGMWPDTESMPELKILKGQILVDTIYNPLETRWLKTGKENGARTIGGLDMFIAQGLASADIWFGGKILEKIKLKPIKKVLKSELC